MKFKFVTQGGTFEIEGSSLKINSSDVQVMEGEKTKALIVKSNLAYLEVLE